MIKIQITQGLVDKFSPSYYLPSLRSKYSNYYRNFKTLNCCSSNSFSNIKVES